MKKEDNGEQNGGEMGTGGKRMEMFIEIGATYLVAIRQSRSYKKLTEGKCSSSVDVYLVSGW